MATDDKLTLCDHAGTCIRAAGHDGNHVIYTGRNRSGEFIEQLPEGKQRLLTHLDLKGPLDREEAAAMFAYLSWIRERKING